MPLEKNPTDGLVVDVFGPTIEFLVEPASAEFCTLKGIIPPGVAIPMHSHADVEDFIVVKGQVAGLQVGPSGHQWVIGNVGDLLHVPSGVPHAWRNDTQEPVELLIFTTPKLGRFFKEIGRPITSASAPVLPEDIGHFMAVCAQYGYWNATPEENAAVGIALG
jgi:quercetin dioxygenase-like cupin family protein